MRVYVPATMRELADWYAAGRLPSTAAGYAAEDETEDGEYAALMAAAEDSAARLSGPGRRVVVVAELADGADENDPVGFEDVAAVHADDDVRAADADPADDLGWYATQEVRYLIAE